MAKNDVALRVNDVSICFNLSKEKVDNFKELFIKKLKGEKLRFNEFWALKDVSFELKKANVSEYLDLMEQEKVRFLK